jgi:hypothetical protein
MVQYRRSPLPLHTKNHKASPNFGRFIIFIVPGNHQCQTKLGHRFQGVISSKSRNFHTRKGNATPKSSWSIAVNPTLTFICLKIPTHFRMTFPSNFHEVKHLKKCTASDLSHVLQQAIFIWIYIYPWT